MIKGKKEIESISIFDPGVKAFREITIEDYKIYLRSLGLKETEIALKVKEFLLQCAERLKNIGLTDGIIKTLLKI